MLNIWLVKLEEKTPADLLANCEAVLDAADQARASAFRLEDAYRRFVVARALARFALSEADPYTIPEQWRFTVSPTGKPTASNGPAFSISHTNEVVACATYAAGAVGVDVESIKLSFPLSKLAAALTQEEMDRLSHLESPDQGAAFARIWTAKEAAAKADGRGLAVDLKKIVLQPSESGYAVTGSAGDWAVWQTTIEPGHCLAVATEKRCVPDVRWIALAELTTALRRPR